MSSRQRRRMMGDMLLAAPAESEEESEEESDEEEENEKKGFIMAFGNSDDSSEEESSSSSSSDEDEAAATRVEPVAKQKLAAKRRELLHKKQEEAEETALLEKLITEVGQEEKEQKEVMGGALVQLLACEDGGKHLNVDYEMRRRLGTSAAAERGERGTRGRGRKAAPRNLRRLLLGKPQADWQKPPSKVGGGLGMKLVDPPSYLSAWQKDAHGREAQWFCFDPSEAYEKLQERFEDSQSTMDPNMLALFVGETLGTHAEGLLQLAMVFAHTGQMDRAGEFVRRCLYVLESSASEGFDLSRGCCRMDAKLPHNGTFMAALFRHAQLSSMMGCHRTALEVAKALLSLDPLGDPLGALLLLEGEALCSRTFQAIIDLHESAMPIGYAPDELAATANAVDEEATGGVLPPVTVKDLPGIGYSLALALLGMGDSVAAKEQIKLAMLRCPVVLEALLEKCEINARSVSHPRNWSTIFGTLLFGGARTRVRADHPASHLAMIYAERSKEGWKNEAALDLLYDGAALALQELGDAGCAAQEPELLDGAYRQGSPLYKYLRLKKPDFCDSFPQLPAEANILDPRLVGPNMMDPARRPRAMEGMMGIGAQWQELEANARAAMMADPGANVGNLDPNEPLVQLFLQSIMPWNRMATPQNPPPR